VRLANRAKRGPSPPSPAFGRRFARHALFVLRRDLFVFVVFFVSS
jgi:hypothetical protein